MKKFSVFLAAFMLTTATTFAQTWNIGSQVKTKNLKLNILQTVLLAFGMNSFAQNDIVWKKNFGCSNRGFCCFRKITLPKKYQYQLYHKGFIW